MTQTLSIRRGENGEAQPIVIKNNAGNLDITWVVSTDTTIVFKNPDDLDTAVLTITNSDFTISSPNVNWTPKDTDWDSLTKKNYIGFIHLKATDARETIAKFFIHIEDT